MVVNHQRCRIHATDSARGANVLVWVAHRREQGKSIIWLAGDSSLDNKYWFSDTADAVNGYEQVLSPPRMKTDVNYWLNYFAAERNAAAEHRPPLAAVNTAIEATALNDRSCARLLAQDRLIQQHIGPVRDVRKRLQSGPQNDGVHQKNRHPGTTGRATRNT